MTDFANKPVCSWCGSSKVTLDATAEFNEETGQIEINQIMDKGHYCNDCDGECSIEWIKN